MMMIMDPIIYYCRSVVAPPLVAATASSASLALAFVASPASSSLGAWLESLQLVGRVCWTSGGGGSRSSLCLHRRSYIHIEVGVVIFWHVINTWHT